MAKPNKTARGAHIPGKVNLDDILRGALQIRKKPPKSGKLVSIGKRANKVKKKPKE